MNTRTLYSPEVRERAVRLFFNTLHDHPSRWAAIQSVSSKIGCTPETLMTNIVVRTVSSQSAKYCRLHRRRIIGVKTLSVLRINDHNVFGDTNHRNLRCSAFGTRITAYTAHVKCGSSLTVNASPLAAGRLKD